MLLDPLSMDPPSTEEPSAATTMLPLASAGHELLNVTLLPAGRGPHPVVVLLHGFPGVERNLDLAHVLRRAGYACLVFHYRGSWGSPGSWSWANGLEDAAAVVDTIRRDDRFDARRIILAGHSYGGFVALQAAAADPEVAGVVSIAGFDLGAAGRSIATDPAGREAYLRAWSDELAPLRGTSAEALVEETLQHDDWSLPDIAPRVADRPILLIGTTRDEVTPAPLHHAPLAAALRSAGARHLDDLLIASDHALSGHRVQLALTVLTFLRGVP